MCPVSSAVWWFCRLQMRRPQLKLKRRFSVPWLPALGGSVQDFHERLAPLGGKENEVTFPGLRFSAYAFALPRRFDTGPLLPRLLGFTRSW